MIGGRGHVYKSAINLHTLSAVCLSLLPNMSRVIFDWETSFFINLARVWTKNECPGREHAVTADDSVLHSMSITGLRQDTRLFKVAKFLPNRHVERLDVVSTSDIRGLDIGDVSNFIANIVKVSNCEQSWSVKVNKEKRGKLIVVSACSLHISWVS